MTKVLVVANETIGGRPLVEALRTRHRRDPDLHAVLCVPRTRPHHGLVVYDGTVAETARVRAELARALLRDWEGIPATIVLGDPDPYTAALDAIDDHAPDEVLVSTRPATTSGWLRRDLVARIAGATDVPVEHVVVDPRHEARPFAIDVVLADAMTDVLALRAWLAAPERAAGRHAVVFVVPGDRGAHPDGSARARLTRIVAGTRGAGWVVAGMTGPPDPYTAARNAAEALHADAVVVATGDPVGAGLAVRLRHALDRPVEHFGGPAARDGGAIAAAA